MVKLLKQIVFFGTGVFCSLISVANAQTIDGGTQPDGKARNSITTAVPFLLISPDSRAGAMGDVGAATTADVSSMHWNPAKYAFAKDGSGVGINYSPWLRSLGVNDINLAYISGYHRFDDQQTLAGSLRFFSLGDITFTDNSGNPFQQINPSEYAIDAAYIRKLSNLFSIAMAARYIHSNLGSGNFNGNEISPGNAFAADVAVYYNKNTIFLNTDANLAWGVNISNIGTKMQYGVHKNFIPTNLKIGGSSTFNFDEKNSLAIALDFNKLLVPTNPIYDSEGNIVAGKDPDKTVPAAIFGSFTDAPGGFKEELNEVSIAMGLEYWFNHLIALRTGYFYENPQKGDRRYFTLGAGIQYNSINFDFSYLVPGATKNPLDKTVRFSVLFNFGKDKTGK
ncbi:type IX secretion system outer membrane channel protein PorV [Solitalea koreensis]|uniref:Type IX secretion system protein PorV domain-containing protein n=1 Tax=Solitalea koreensis TaxID=543615 RepID=A0A521CMA6_9SPHI|nr:type IX secretion system outer membrane channel protein PorV [Solitalea koreensis]SMO60566.1 hypothetical protein SAMN06265350_104201 [Solitalea koreensis]